MATLDLAKFIRHLRAELIAGGAWENDDLASFLEALSAWISDSPGAYNNRGEQVAVEASWPFRRGRSASSHLLRVTCPSSPAPGRRASPTWSSPVQQVRKKPASVIETPR